MKKVEPARYVSVLAPYKKGLQRLKERGYTLSQMQSFLAANGVVVSRAWISAYLTRAQKGPGAGVAERRQAQAPQTNVDASPQPPEPEQSEDQTNRHNPRTLNNILSSMPDLDSLSRAAKGNKS